MKNLLISLLLLVNLISLFGCQAKMEVVEVVTDPVVQIAIKSIQQKQLLEEVLNSFGERHINCVGDTVYQIERGRIIIALKNDAYRTNDSLITDDLLYSIYGIGPVPNNTNRIVIDWRCKERLSTRIETDGTTEGIGFFKAYGFKIEKFDKNGLIDVTVKPGNSFGVVQFKSVSNFGVDEALRLIKSYIF